MTNTETAQHDQTLATIANLNAQTAKLLIDSDKAKKELKWYEITIIIAGTLAVVAVAKLFL